jgi:hypothetical protein
LEDARRENASLQEENQLAPPGTIPGPAEDFPEGAAAIMAAAVGQYGVQVWGAKPLHYLPTCELGNILEIVKNGGNIVEFADPKFPDLSTHLNSQQYPMTAAVFHVSEEQVIKGGNGSANYAIRMWSLFWE